MCGIAGIVDWEREEISSAEIGALTDSLVHRGPDDGGHWLRPHAALGSRRLAVIDLSPRGHMPMLDPSGRVAIVHNGEIYNFQQVRAELRARGHEFRSGNDTEVALYAYLEWGEDCAERLSGMFAFAIWDERERKLFAARDRLGVKPLFYTLRGRKLVFASEVHALYAHLQPTAENIDPFALDHYLGFGYVPPSGSFVQGIEKLPPGHCMVYDRDGLRTRRYWQVRFRPTRPLSFEEAADAVDDALAEAVRQRLVADVPLGSFLSGGIDSGLVTAHAARQTAGRLRTFSVGFPGNPAEADELGLARRVAERYDTEHTELEVSPATRDWLPRIVWHYGEPFADASAFAVYQISKEARKHITVALTGDGGDESFAGYGNIRASYLAQRYRESLPAPLRSAVRGLLDLPLPLPQRERAARWIDMYVDRPIAEHYDMPTHWTVAMRAELYDEALGFDPELHTGNRLVEELQREAHGLADAEQHMYIDLHRRLPGDYLTKVDIASSMVSLELRSPFLDYRLVELAASLPLEVKAPHGRQKALLRHLAARHLPDEIVKAPKRGFAPPIEHWMRGDWLPMVREVVGERLAAREKLFDADVIHRAIDEHASGRANHTTRLYSLLCLEIWWELFIDRSLAPSDPL